MGSAIGWFLLPRSFPADRASQTSRDGGASAPAVSLPVAEQDQRQQLFSRLRALQVDRGWFLRLVDASLNRRFPERGDSPPTDSLEDAPLRRVWMELAEEWMARIELLPPAIRARLGRLQDDDWEQSRQALQQQGVHPRVVELLVSAGAQIAGAPWGRKPAEPWSGLMAAAMSLGDVAIEQITAQPLNPPPRHCVSLPVAPAWCWWMCRLVTLWSWASTARR